MSIPSTIDSELVISFLGSEITPSNIIISGTMWTVFEQSGSIRLREVEATDRTVYNINENTLSFYIISNAFVGGVVLTDKFFLWTIEGGDLYVETIEPIVGAAPIQTNKTLIESGATSVGVVLEATLGVRIGIVNTSTNNLRYKAYFDITGAVDFEKDFAWPATRPDQISMTNVTDLNEFIVTYKDTSSPPNVFEELNELTSAMEFIINGEIIGKGLPFAFCGEVVGDDPFDYPDLFNEKGTIDEINAGGFEVVMDIDPLNTIQNITYPDYLFGGVLSITGIPGASVVITAHFESVELVNVGGIFKDIGATATATSILAGTIDVSHLIQRYGYVNVLKKGVYTLIYFIDYGGHEASLTRQIHIVEPQWNICIVPSQMIENSVLLRQLAQRLSDIYWEVNYKNDKTRFAFDSRLAEVPLYSSRFKIPKTTTDSVNEIDPANDTILCIGFTYLEGDTLELRVESPDTFPGGLDAPAWNITINYGFDVLIEFEGLIYVSISSGNLGNQPDTSPDEWKPRVYVVIDTLAEGRWKIGNSFVVGDLVSYIDLIWINLIPTNSIEPGTDETVWVEASRITIGFISNSGAIVAEDITSTGTGTLLIRRINEQVDSEGFIYELLDYDADPVEEPGTPKNFWDRSVLYITQDQVDRNGVQYIAIEESQDADPDTHPSKWKIADWLILNNFQRVGSVDDKTSLRLAYSKGMPEFLYQELAGTIKSKVTLNKVFKVIKDSRGTIPGFQSLLNLVGLSAVVEREAPEEALTIPNPFLFELIQGDSTTYPRKGIWNINTAYIVNDIVYLGDAIYVCIIGNTGLNPSSNPAEWTNVWEYAKVAGDNSCYEIDISGFNADTESEFCIEDEELQAVTTGLLSNILRFSIPAYIKYDASLAICNVYGHFLAHQNISSFVQPDDIVIPPYIIDLSAKVIGAGGFTGGTVNLPGENIVDANTNINIIATPDVGYQFVDWIVLEWFGPGSDGPAVTEIGDNLLANTTAKVNKGHTIIQAVFEEIP